MDQKSILTVTLNPALDLTVELDIVKLGAVNIAQDNHLQPGGKGINVARVLADLGANVSATGILGAENKQEFDLYFSRNNIRDKFSTVAGSTRVNVKLCEQNDQVTDINLPGISIDKNDWEIIYQTIIEAAKTSDLVVLAGSLPKGIDFKAYQKLVREVKALGIPVFVDVSGEAFNEALKAAPTLIKPNVAELEQAMGKSLASYNAIKTCAHELLATGIEHIVVSDGANGCYWFTENESIRSTPPKIDIVSTVGAGDSLVAGIAFGLVNEMNIIETLRLATAVSAYAVEQVGVGIPNKNRLDKLTTQVDIDVNHP